MTHQHRTFVDGCPGCLHAREDYQAEMQQLREERDAGPHGPFEPVNERSYTTRVSSGTTTNAYGDYTEAKRTGYHDGAEMVRDAVMVDLVRLTDALHTLEGNSLKALPTSKFVDRDLRMAWEAVEAIEATLRGEGQA